MQPYFACPYKVLSGKQRAETIGKVMTIETEK